MQCAIHAARTYGQVLRMYKFSSDPGCRQLRAFAPRRVERSVGANLGERERREGATMVSSASSQESRVRAGERALLGRRPRHGPHGKRTNARKLTNYVAKDVVEECEGALAAIARRGDGPEMGRREANRSVHAHVGAAEDDGDEVCQVWGVTRSRTILRFRKNVLPVIDFEGVAMDDDANGTKQVVFGKNKDDIDELCVDTTPAQGLICPEVKATKEEAAGLKAAQDENLAAQIRFLENQVRIHNAKRMTLKSASDARLARTVYYTNPPCDRNTQKRFNSAEKTVADNAATAWHYYTNLLKAKKAEKKHLLHGTRPSAALEEPSGLDDSQRLAMITAIVKALLS